MWVYIKTEPGLWTVGFYDPKARWHSDSDHTSPDTAATRVNYLNGGMVQGAQQASQAFDLRRRIAVAIPPDIAAAAEALRRWASENDLGQWSVNGIGPVSPVSRERPLWNLI